MSDSIDNVFSTEGLYNDCKSREGLDAFTTISLVVIGILGAVVGVSSFMDWLKKKKDIKDNNIAKEKAKEYIEKLSGKVSESIIETQKIYKEYVKNYNKYKCKYKLNPRYNKLVNYTDASLQKLISEKVKTSLENKKTYEEGYIEVYIKLQDTDMRNDIDDLDPDNDESYDEPGPIWNYHEDIFEPFNDIIKKETNKNDFKKDGIEIDVYNFPTYGIDHNIYIKINL